MRDFGRLDDGRTVEAFTLGRDDGLQAEILTYGGILRRLTFPAHGTRRELVLGLRELAQYVADRAFLGVLVGRFANRIAGATFELDGQRHTLAANDGVNQLHGGLLGFGKRLWRVLNWQPTPVPRLWLQYSSPAGEEGYPGNLEVTVALTVDAAELELRFEARCDAPTPFNPTYHPYFNLSGDAQLPIDRQLLRLPASRFLAVADCALIPTGELRAVEGTPFDFRTARPLRTPPLDSDAQLRHASGYDHCWVLDRGADCAAELFSPDSGVRMRIESDAAGVQLYAGQWLTKQYPGLGHAVCLEPGGLPNAVNEPRFPSTILRPGTTRHALIAYRFSVD
jgi:aldose 1-epimerase